MIIFSARGLDRLKSSTVEFFLGVLGEAEFYALTGLADLCKKKIKEENTVGRSVSAAIFYPFSSTENGQIWGF